MASSLESALKNIEDFWSANTDIAQVMHRLSCYYLNAPTEGAGFMSNIPHDPRTILGIPVALVDEYRAPAPAPVPATGRDLDLAYIRKINSLNRTPVFPLVLALNEMSDSDYHIEAKNVQPAGVLVPNILAHTSWQVTGIFFPAIKGNEIHPFFQEVMRDPASFCKHIERYFARAYHRSLNPDSVSETYHVMARQELDRFQDKRPSNVVHFDFGQ